MTTYAARKARIYDRLGHLEKLVDGHGELSGWDLREQLLQTLERLPQSDMARWLDEHRQAAEFIAAQQPPTSGT